jgi:hypothetical protein
VEHAGGNELTRLILVASLEASFGDGLQFQSWECTGLTGGRGAHPHDWNCHSPDAGGNSRIRADSAALGRGTTGESNCSGALGSWRSCLGSSALWARIERRASPSRTLFQRLINAVGHRRRLPGLRRVWVLRAGMVRFGKMAAPLSVFSFCIQPYFRRRRDIACGAPAVAARRC